MAEPGPTLKDYVETRFNLIEQSISERFAANTIAVDAAFAAAKEAVLKAETATEKRLEGLNELRGAMGDQQRLLIQRSEVELMRDAMGERVNGLKSQIDGIAAVVEAVRSERRGMVGGWGYAIGLIGIVVALVTLFAKMK